MAAGDADGCVSLLAKLTEAERRALAADALLAHREAHRERIANISRPLKDPDRAQAEARRATAFLAVLGTATLAEIKKAPSSWGDARVYDVLTARRPQWLENCCALVLNRRGLALSVGRPQG